MTIAESEILDASILIVDATFPSTASSNCIARAMVLEEPPSLDAGEMTDKGSINQRAVLSRRAALVDELYRQPPGEKVICV
jgi:feruloyl-CoA synthase